VARRAAVGRQSCVTSRGRVYPLGSPDRLRCQQRTRSRPRLARGAQLERAACLPGVSKWTGDVVPTLWCDIRAGRVVLRMRYSTRPITEILMRVLAVLVLVAVVACGK